MKPNHRDRLKFLRNRLKKFRTEDEIIKEIKTLQWPDFNENVTIQQIRFAKKYF